MLRYKFRNKVDGTEYSDIWDVFKFHCNKQEHCHSCRFINTGFIITCRAAYLAKNKSAELAESVGFEVIEVYTKQDIEDAKAIKHIFPWAKQILPCGTDYIMVSDCNCVDGKMTKIPLGELFPILKSQRSVLLAELLQDEVDK